MTISFTQTFQSPEAFSAQLVRNLRAYAATFKEGWDAKELDQCEVLSESFCRHLLASRGSLSAALQLYPEQSETLLDTVRWDAFVGSPVGVVELDGKHFEVQAQARRLKLRFNPFDGHPVDIADLGLQAALDVELELRGWLHHKYGSLPRVYAIHLPPYLGPTFLPKGDWSVDRGLRLRYAKVY